MRLLRTLQPHLVTTIPRPPVATVFFADTRMAWLWLLLRLYLGYEWLWAVWEKLTGHTLFGEAVKGGSWVFSGHDGLALRGFLQGALAKTGGPHPAILGWYAWFLQHLVLPAAPAFAYLITFGQLLVALGLIFGCLTGIAAFFSAFMNLNFLLAGAVGINPVMGTLAFFLILAWRIAGYYGIDHYLLPLLGTPWTGPLRSMSPMRSPNG